MPPVPQLPGLKPQVSRPMSYIQRVYMATAPSCHCAYSSSPAAPHHVPFSFLGQTQPCAQQLIAPESVAIFTSQQKSQSASATTQLALPNATGTSHNATEISHNAAAMVTPIRRNLPCAEHASATAPSELPPFIMAASIPAIPGKLVRKIQAGVFVEMKDLLPDNIALLEQWEAMPSSTHVCGMPHRTPRREVTSVTTWAACFATYVSILGQAHPHLVQDRLGYMQLVLCEARHHGGQSVQLGEPWARLQTSLVAA